MKYNCPNRCKVVPISFSITILFLLSFSFAFFPTVRLNAQSIPPKPLQRNPTFGFVDRGDSVEFVFGQQQKVRVGDVEIQLEERFNEIEKVNVAGDFNGWSPNDDKYQMVKVDGKLFKIRICKARLGKKGDLRQFKFVVNEKYWIEPPLEASNKYKGADGNVNLTLQL